MFKRVLLTTAALSFAGAALADSLTIDNESSSAIMPSCKIDQGAFKDGIAAGANKTLGPLPWKILVLKFGTFTDIGKDHTLTCNFTTDSGKKAIANNIAIDLTYSGSSYQAKLDNFNPSDCVNGYTCSVNTTTGNLKVTINAKA